MFHGLESLLVTYAVIQSAIFLVLIRFGDLYEHEPLFAICLMAVWGATGAAAMAVTLNQFIRGFVYGTPEIVFGSSIAAPFAEEIAKGLALVVAFSVSALFSGRFGTKRLRGLTDGIVYGSAVGIGFAFTEDVQYLLLAGPETFVQRRDFFGFGMLTHALFTAAVGAGIGLATWSRRRLSQLGFAIGGFVIGLVLHALNNGLPQMILAQRFGISKTAAWICGGGLGYQPTGPTGETCRVTGDLPSLGSEEIARLYQTQTFSWRVGSLTNYLEFLVAAAAVAIWLARQRYFIRLYLPAEVDKGLIDERDADLVPHFWKRTWWYWELMRVGELERARTIRRIHIELANLALLKSRLTVDAREMEDIERVRQRIATLKAAQRVDVYAPISKRLE